MRIRVGCEMTYDFEQATPMIVVLNVHASRVSDLERPDYLITTPSVPLEGYRDSFGNWCNRLVAPLGRFSLKTETIVRDSGRPDPTDLGAEQHQVQNLPAETLLFLLGSRYCETDRLSDIAWSLFGTAPRGGSGCRRFVTSSTTISPSDMSTRARPARPPTPMKNGAGSAAIMPIWLSHSAAA
jgi:transglutaminase-like putative cysteine protease